MYERASLYAKNVASFSILNIPPPPPLLLYCLFELHVYFLLLLGPYADVLDFVSELHNVALHNVAKAKVLRVRLQFYLNSVSRL